MESMARSRHTLGRGEELEECEDERTRVVEWWPLFDYKTHAAGRAQMRREDCGRLYKLATAAKPRFVVTFVVVGACCAVVQL